MTEREKLMAAYHRGALDAYESIAEAMSEVWWMRWLPGWLLGMAMRRLADQHRPLAMPVGDGR